MMMETSIYDSMLGFQFSMFGEVKLLNSNRNRTKKHRPNESMLSAFYSLLCFLLSLNAIQVNQATFYFVFLNEYGKQTFGLHSQTLVFKITVLSV